MSKLLPLVIAVAMLSVCYACSSADPHPALLGDCTGAGCVLIHPSGEGGTSDGGGRDVFVDTSAPDTSAGDAGADGG